MQMFTADIELGIINTCLILRNCSLIALNGNIGLSAACLGSHCIGHKCQ